MFEIAVAAKSLFSDGLNGTIDDDDWEYKPLMLLLTALNEPAELIDPFSEVRPIELKFEVDDDLVASKFELESNRRDVGGGTLESFLLLNEV